MSKQSLGQKPLADALLECAQAEAGTIHMDTDGWPVLTSRQSRTAATVATTLPGSALDADVTWTLDGQQLSNSATISRMAGDTEASSLTRRNDTSIAAYGEQPSPVGQLWLHTDEQAAQRADAEATMWASPLPRSSDLAVDLATKAATVTVKDLLAADPGDRIAVSGMPAEAPDEVQFFIEKIADTVTTSGWQRTFTVSPRLTFWTLEHAEFGVIDATNMLAY